MKRVGSEARVVELSDIRHPDSSVPMWLDDKINSVQMVHRVILRLDDCETKPTDIAPGLTVVNLLVPK